MKKLSILAIALTLLVGCAQNETVSVSDANMISFSNAFVDNATRADLSFDKNNLTEFSVWGHHGGTMILKNTTVTKQADLTWDYIVSPAKPQWEEGEEYYFHAFAPKGAMNITYPVSTSVTGIPANIDYELDVDKRKQDLIYAIYTRTQGFTALGETVDYSKVEFSFRHLLSRVKFTFTNKLTSGESIEILDVKITNVQKKAIAHLDDMDNTKWKWDGHNSESTYDFGGTGVIPAVGSNEKSAADVLFVIPAPAKDYEVLFTIKYGGEISTKKATVVGLQFEMGYSYNFKAEINDDDVTKPNNEINFDVIDVMGWDTKVGSDVVLDFN